jgi:DNA-binding NarL/FixJ family response regulator
MKHKQANDHDLPVVDVATSGEELEETSAASRPEIAIVDTRSPDEGRVSAFRRLSGLFSITGLIPEPIPTHAVHGGPADNTGRRREP